MNYTEYLNRKQIKVMECGMKTIPSLNQNLFGFQKDVVEFLLRQGRGAAFLDTGLGKTFVQLEWASKLPVDTLLLAPLCVGKQTEREAQRFGIDAKQSRDGNRKAKVTIANYEMLQHFDLSDYGAIVLDESSILKSFDGKTKQMLVDAFKTYKWKLACTATPAPNDHLELGNHAEFLSVMDMKEMLARFFVHDSGDTAKWRLKRHGEKPFWQWVASWAACLSNPSDLGYSNEGFELPPLILSRHTLDSRIVTNIESGMLFDIAGCSATNLHQEKRNSLNERTEMVAAIANKTTESVCVWCESNDESKAFAKAIPDAVEVSGSMSSEEKEDRLDAFSMGKSRVIVTKASIAGFGLNWQHCHRVVFGSISFSYESFYQAVRRFWRFGQKHPVTVDVITSSNETPVWQAVERKMNDHEAMKSSMLIAAKEFAAGIKHNTKQQYNPTHEGKLPIWIQNSMLAA